VQSYVEAAELLAEHVSGRDLTTLTRADLEDFLTDQLTRRRPTSAAVRFRSLQQFYRWLVAEDLVNRSPMTGLRPPTVPEKPVPVLDDAAINRLLGCVSGQGFDDRRDNAIMRLLLDTGMRLSELTNLRVDDIDLDTDVAIVLGKGGRPRACPYGDKTGQALERYLRERAKHPRTQRAELWLGQSVFEMSRRVYVIKPPGRFTVDRWPDARRGARATHRT
jgi:site-specific recombinase XerD